MMKQYCMFDIKEQGNEWIRDDGEIEREKKRVIWKVKLKVLC